MSLDPATELKLDNLLAGIGLLLQTLKDRDQRDADVDARLQRIERAVGAPLLCSLKSACQRLNVSITWAREHMDLFPKRVGAHKYLIVDIEAMAQRLPDSAARKRKRRNAA